MHFADAAYWIVSIKYAPHNLRIICLKTDLVQALGMGLITLAC